ncbi:arylamine N-acetyltransferase [Kitasatospora sp. NPDC088391]|uniref:arylamine N-acetyltransferase family protein n=1 Tax=Kitasatospora sp. NPDC088391 TaxID=3364074 RepID=UPI0037F72FDA
MTVDLDKYFARIGWAGDPAPTLDTLRALHHAHVLAIPFENLDVVAGGVPSLELGELEAKLVGSARGGYCFEQNSLLAAVLEELGYGVTRLTGRVRAGARPGEERPRTHMVLAVEVPGTEGRQLADVGFGGPGALLEPLPMIPGRERAAGGRRHRLLLEDADGPAPVHVLQAHRDGDWADQSSFTLDRTPAVDLRIGNWYTATHPRSPFHRLYVQRPLPTGDHLALDGSTFTRTTPDGTRTRRHLTHPDALLELLETEFGITPPPGFRPAIDRP